MTTLPAQSATDGIATSSALPARLIAIAILVIGTLVLWHSAGDHPLYSPDELRYASVAAEMADSGDWMVPRFQGHVHLTKPPLTYWLEGACIAVLGHTPGAPRLPSLLASTIAICLLFFTAVRLYSWRVAALAAGMYVIMPLPLIVGRLAVTDPILNMAWTGVLCFGCLAVMEQRKRWVVLMWLALAVGLITKGPVALTPAVVVFVWLAAGRQFAAMRRMHPWFGLPLAALPALAWVFALVQWHPEAIDVWKHELVDRVTGSGAHVEPWWYYIPVFLGGLFPATIMLPVPGRTVTWATMKSRMKDASPIALWTFAGVMPLIMFTLVSGKLATYLLPLAAPWAMLSALTLEKWLTGEADRAQSERVRPPEVIATFTIVLAIATTAGVVAASMFDWRISVTLAPLVFGIAVAIWTWRHWRRYPLRRVWGLAGIWISLCMTWLWVFEAEDTVWMDSEPALILQTLNHAAETMGYESVDDVHIAVYRIRDASFEYYSDITPTRLRTKNDLKQFRDSLRAPTVLVVDDDDWNDLLSSDPQLASSFEVVDSYVRWFQDKTLVLRPTQTPASL